MLSAYGQNYSCCPLPEDADHDNAQERASELARSRDELTCECQLQDPAVQQQKLVSQGKADDAAALEILDENAILSASIERLQARMDQVGAGQD